MDEAVKPDVQSGLSNYLSHKKKRYPCHVNRISALDDPCLRKLYYKRANWADAEPIDDGLQGIFETGNVLEPVIERIVSEVGHAADPPWRIVGAQTPTNDQFLKDHNISGKIDGFLQRENPTTGKWETLGVVDIKTMSPNVYRGIKGYQSLTKYPWTRKYRGQLMLYALAHNVERCYLLLVNKQNLYDMRLIDFDIDMDYCERLIQKADAVSEAVEKGEPPAKINDPDTCERCEYRSLCMPEYQLGSDMEISDNEELEGILERLAELEPVEKEIKDLKKQRDAMLVKGQNVSVGKWLITWKKSVSERTPQPAKTIERWTKKIQKIDS